MANLSAKEFLLQECLNLQDVLEETLRFKYGLEGSKDFFEECQARLTYIKGEVTSSAETEHDRLQIASFLLCNLSNLISRIERSTIGEYSWPFVEELKRIAAVTCTEATASNPNAIPQFHVWSSGGLDGYAIEPEQGRPTGSRKRIHTIVLPKTLKHGVLLHSILGHEVGHAMYRCSKHQAALSAIVQRLIAATPLENSAQTAKWLYSSSAPALVKKQLVAPDLVSRGVNVTNFFSTVASWHAWLEEILCDLVGLTTFGPSFVAAECNLLLSMDPSGSGIGPRHPLAGCRANYLATAAAEAGWTTTRFSDSALQSSFDEFWRFIFSKTQKDPWFDVIPATQLRSAVSDLQTLFAGLQPALYQAPDKETLKLLVDQLFHQTPPVGFEVGSLQTVCWRHVDFRHILYAGWIAAANNTGLSFLALNRLCEHAIMQQRSIYIELGKQ
jgi:hypothetical protein